VRKTAVLLSFLVVLPVLAQSATPDALLDRGMTAYRSGDYSSAVTDLQAAAQAFLSPDKMQAYVNSGKFEGLDKFESALVYLALAQSRLGREADARETILRLMSAERISPTYARLQIAEAGEFDTLVATLTPGSTLPRNVQVAGGTTTTTTTTTTSPAPEPVTIAEAPAPATATTATTPAATVAQAEQDRLAIQRTLAEERAERQRIVDEMVARLREQIQREADARIAEERQAAERAAAERVAAAEREAADRVASAQSEAQQRVAAVETEANQRVATAQTEAQQRVAQIETEASQRATAVQTEAQQRIDAANRDAEARIAALQNQAQERLTAAEADAASRIAAAQRDAEQRVAEAQAAAQRDAEARIASIQQEAETRIAAERAAAAAQIAEAAATTRRAYLASLRQADASASQGEIDDANSLYMRVANSENVPREVLAQAAIGLYRTGSFRNAVSAFRRLGTFAKGEEDLRYYNAVALYETGSYSEAQKELSCALPFIQVTDDVTRYRVKIEQTAQQQALAR